MIPLADKPNVEAPSGSYNYGRLKDNAGANDGTPVNRLVYNDMHEFFESLMVYADITPNGLPDSDDDGYQLISAFVASAKRATAPLLKMAAESLIGNPLSVTTNTAPGALLGVEWNVGATILSPGYIIWESELYFTGGYTGAIVDTAVFTKVAANVLVVTDAVSGSGDFDFSDIVRTKREVENPNAVIKKVVDIGDWDMDTNATKSVATGVASNKIRSITGFVRDDADTLFYPIGYSDGVPVLQLWGGAHAGGSVTLLRLGGGTFDNSNYNATSFNRGWLVVEYVL